VGLHRLEERRMRSDLIETFKIVNRKYDINPELFFQQDEGDTRGHDQKLFQKRFRLNVKKYAFSNRVIDNWNLVVLPVAVVVILIRHCVTNLHFAYWLASSLKLAARCPVSGCLPSRIIYSSISMNHMFDAIFLVISQCNITFLLSWLSQGSVATLIRWGAWSSYRHVSFIINSHNENCIKIRWFFTKLETKISWLRFYGSRCSC